MRENRPYGSEGGVGESRSLPLSPTLSGCGADGAFMPTGDKGCSLRRDILPLGPTLANHEIIERIFRDLPP